jgi:hypothetical protein
VGQSLVFSVVFCRSLFVFSRVRVAHSLDFSVVFCHWPTWTALKANNDLQNTTQKSKDWGTRTPLSINNDLQNTTQKSKDWATQTPLKDFCVVFCRSLFVFSGVRVAQSLDFCVVFCRSLFVFSGVRVAQSLDFCVVFCRLSYTNPTKNKPWSTKYYTEI